MKSILNLLKSFLKSELRYTLWIPVYLIGFAVLEHLPPRPYWPTQFPIDDAIPFCSWFVLIYATWYFQLILTGIYVLRRSPAAYRRYMHFLALTFLSSIVLWIFLPNGQDLRPENPEGALAPLVKLLYQIDTNTNVFPSLHVAGSIGAALAAFDAVWPKKKVFCSMETLLSVLIILSTLFVKQHSILDVIGGIVFSIPAAGIAYRLFPEGMPSRQMILYRLPVSRRNRTIRRRWPSRRNRR